MDIIDAHQHLWQITRAECHWPNANLTAIYRDYNSADFTAVSAPLGVTGSVLVQSQPSEADTDYLLQLADGNKNIGAVVGWANLAAPTASQSIAQLAKRDKLRGLRPMLQSEAAANWIVASAQAPGLEAMIEQGLSLDALITSRHLAAIATLAARYPELNIIIDHGAKPNIAGGQWHEWSEPLARLAQYPNVSCKLSGLITEAKPAACVSEVKPYADTLLQLFGGQRLLWGSDWPVLNLHSDYASWLMFCRQWLRATAPDVEEAVLAGNAKRWYRIQ
ncbi:amidohydrolase family protein [Gilvimarinus polysaccharolyticus]|uniref:amidohydrolase family protein n=1 Tax=Gilvimarinus polysaccharolyticus TaxID=863921 RepID=UPI000673C1ED|nr:amidohydrolase family protein [Gilvimarinus polysaccharolyticus]